MNSVPTLRIGNGYDLHRLVIGRPLILGGVQIPHPKGLWGHSDADVLTHALIDALLGASNLGDIGALFPDNDSRFKDICSLELLRKVRSLLEERRWNIINVDCVVICQQPKILPWKQQIQTNLAECLQINPEQIGLKGKTAEQLGALGREEGIAAYVVGLLSQK